MQRFGTVIFLFLALCTSAFADDISLVGEEISEGKHKGVKGGIVAVDGKILFEAYAPGEQADKARDIRSATKSITSLLIGKMIELEMLKSVDVRVSEILPDEFAHMAEDDPRRNIRIKDILTMRTGLACNDWQPASLGQEDKMYETPDWAAFILSQPLSHETGEHFSYCTGGVVLLGRVIEKLSGMKVPAFADKHLFAPLGIKEAKWDETPKGYTDTGGHLKLTLKSLYRIGEMMASGGEGVIPASWVKDAVEPRTRIYERPEGYGYLWWLHGGEIEGKKVTLIYAHGNGGNFIFLVPELKIVAAFTGVNFGSRDQFIPKNLLTRRIIPALLK
ncbi:serine hydrolase [Kordiimonas sp. SCSIO 12603]|uniref:serine hydrolase domain-containing protein n=1 Tax=Kordiimonas sp. SCSIO 12603 TaxID=2829596 RepID=UPI002103FAD9|nr:serine hydrolase [Kordiimonas sp. SCSIO 12603]UTW59704.1 serine hydrolase [Kordiimonas sp. SCSIO 12603]